MENSSFTGKYWLTNQDGNYFSLEIRQTSEGTICGSLSGMGVVYGVTAIKSGKKLVGKFTAANFAAIYFKLYRTFQGMQLIILNEKSSNQRFQLISETERNRSASVQ